MKNLETRTGRVEIAFEALKKAKLLHKEQTFEHAIELNQIFSKAYTREQINKCLSKVDININYSDMSTFGNGIVITIK